MSKKYGYIKEIEKYKPIVGYKLLPFKKKEADGNIKLYNGVVISVKVVEDSNIVVFDDCLKFKEWYKEFPVDDPSELLIDS